MEMARAERSVIAAGVRYDKRAKAVHRYEIIDARGRLQLTVPLGKPHGANGGATWGDCPVSTHDQWWHRHITALESAYGRTPYFEFLIDKFSGVFRSPEDWPVWPNAIDLIREANEVVCRILSIEQPEYDFSADTRPEISVTSEDFPRYWQVREHLHGFHPGLSVLDLIFNLGPEASLLFPRR